MILVKGSKIRFTKHAREKFEVVRRYGFDIDKNQVINAIQDPSSSEQKGGQFFASKVLDSKYGLRVVYERRKDYYVVITFYPVRRERYGL